MTSKLMTTQSPWASAFAALAVLSASIIYGYWGTIQSMYLMWLRTDTYAHGMVVLPIVAWLMWSERKQLGHYIPQPTAIFLVLLIPIVFAWLLGQLAAVNALTQFSAMAIFAICVMSIIGKTLSLRLAFPIAFLFFAVPIGDFMMPKLMEWTADFTVLALRATGIPVYREGLQFVIPTGFWSVVEACSGIRYLIASLMVGTLFAYLTYNSLKKRLIFIAISFIVPIVANWLRAYLIVMLGHLSGNKLAAGVDHLIYGWVFFGIVIGAMFAVGVRWSDPREETSSNADSSDGMAKRHASPWPVVIPLIGIIFAGPFAYDRLTQAEDRPPPELAVEIEGWQAAPKFVAWKPAYASPSAELDTAFVNEGTHLGLYIGYYRNQNFERKLITSTNLMVQYKDPNWATAAEGNTDLSLNGQMQRVRTTRVTQKAESQAIRLQAYSWYWINGHITSSDIEGKIYTALYQLLGKGDDSAVIVIYAPSLDNATSTAIHQFLAVNGKNIEKMLHLARNQQ